MTSRTTLFCAVVLMMGMVSLPVSADDNMDAALACFKEGKTLFKDGQYEKAADKFREAYDLKPSWKLLFNIGQSEAAAKRHGLALEAFERFLAEGGDDIVESRRDQVFAEVERLRKIVGFVKVKAPTGTVVMVDGVKRGDAPVYMLLPVSVGIEHVVSGTLKGTALNAQRFRVTGGQTMTVELVGPEPQAPAGVETAASAEPPPSPARTEVDKTAAADDGAGATDSGFPFVTTGWIVSGIGAGAAIVGAALGGVALSKNRKLVDACGDAPCPDKRDDETSRDRVSASSTALLAAGGTLVAAGVTLLIVGKLRGPKETPVASFAPGADGKSMTATIGFRF